MGRMFLPYNQVRTSAAVVALMSMRTFSDAIWLYTLELNTPNACKSALSRIGRAMQDVVVHARQPHHLGDADGILSVRPNSESHGTNTTSRTSVGGRKELLCEVPMTQCPPLQPCMKPPFATAVDTQSAQQCLDSLAVLCCGNSAGTM